MCVYFFLGLTTSDGGEQGRITSRTRRIRGAPIEAFCLLRRWHIVSCRAMLSTDSHAVLFFFELILNRRVNPGRQAAVPGQTFADRG